MAKDVTDPSAKPVIPTNFVLSVDDGVVLFVVHYMKFDIVQKMTVTGQILKKVERDGTYWLVYRENTLRKNETELRIAGMEVEASDFLDAEVLV